HCNADELVSAGLFDVGRKDPEVICAPNRSGRNATARCPLDEPLKRRVRDAGPKTVGAVHSEDTLGSPIKIRLGVGNDQRGPNTADQDRESLNSVRAMAA